MVRRTRRKPRRSTKTFWVMVLIIFGAFAVVWWVWPGLYNASPHFDSLLLQKNQERLRLLNGETLPLHPQDKVRILKVSTNITFNLGVRLYSNRFDANALLYDERALSSFLPKEGLDGEQRIRIHVMHENRDLGFIDLLVRRFVEDWLEKAERMIEPARRVEVLEEALKSVPEDRRVRARLLQEYMTLQKWKEASQLLENMAKEDPTPRTLQDLVEVYRAMGYKEGILSSLKRLVGMQPGDLKARLEYASTLEQEKKTGEAILEYAELLRRTEGPAQLPYLKALGFLYSQVGENYKAIQQFKKALEWDKDDPNLYYNLSSLYEKEGLTEDSDRYLAEAIRLKPGDQEARLRLGEHLLSRGRLEDAERYVTEVLQKSPKSMPALLLMVQIYDKQQKLGKLKEIYQKIYALDPGNEVALYNLGVLEYESGNLAAAVPHLEKYVETHPAEAPVQTLLLDAYRKLNKHELAFKKAQALVALNPKDESLHYFIFEYLNSRGDYEGTIEAMKSALRSLPDNQDFRKYLILAYLRTGKEAMALEQMEELAQGRPKDTALLLQLARLQEKLGKNADAMKTYGKVLAASPGHEEAGEAYLRLRMKGLPLE